MAKRGKHLDKSFAPIRQRKNAKGIEDFPSIGYSREEPVQVLLIDALGEEGDNCEKFPGVRAKLFEHRRPQRQFDRFQKRLLVLCIRRARSSFLTFPFRVVYAPFVLVCNSRQQSLRFRFSYPSPRFQLRLWLDIGGGNCRSFVRCRWTRFKLK